MLFEENKVLDEANKRLLKQYHKERSGSGGKRTDNASTKVREKGRRTALICMLYCALIYICSSLSDSLAFHVHYIVGSNVIISPLCSQTSENLALR